MTRKSAQKDMLSALLTSRWEQTGVKLATLAEAFPAEHYETKPVDSVRTFGDVLRHLAFWNQFVADSAGGRKADDTSNELPAADYATKAKILAVLKKSAAEAAAALEERSAGLPPETVEMVLSFIEHTSEHYGQLVVYARLYGIVPPASRTGN